MKYFIGYRLKGDDESKVESLRQGIARRFDVHAALRIPPHFTLHYPFELGDVALLQTLLREFSAGRRAFSIEVQKFDCFEPRVWFLDVGHNPQCQGLRDDLKATVSALGIAEEGSFPEPFHFHITLAYKDLTPEKFSAIRDFLQQHPIPLEKLDIDSISLFEKHDDVWTLVRDFPFVSS